MGEGGGEGGNEFGGGAVVEGRGPAYGAESIVVGADAPQAVVVSFGQVAQADPVVWCGDVGVAEVVVVQGPTKVAQGLESRVADGGGAGEVARGDEVLLERVLADRGGQRWLLETGAAPADWRAPRDVRRNGEVTGASS
ncbi:hypothetical protein GCM10010214_12670 [Streptomyces abikoensis]|nr:hypothetical protein GCM10010214_12670 [Streptomyces abikoensis]